MYSPPPVTLLLPRALLEHPLPVVGVPSPTNGTSATINFLSAQGPATLQIGLVDRWGRSNATPPGLTLELFSVLCALLSLRDRGPITYNSLFRLLTPSSGTCSAHHRERLKQTLATLSSIDCSLVSPISPSPVFSSLLSFTPTNARAVFGRPTPAFLPVFNASFLEALADASATVPFRFDSFLSIRSRLSRSLFCFLPTWAHYSRATAAKPFRITLSKLITHLGYPVPTYASQRKAFFYGHRSQGLLDELQNLPTPFGLLNFAVTPAASVNDDCLMVWYTGVPRHTLNEESAATSERLQPAHKPSKPLSTPAGDTSSESFRHLKIYQAWIDSGRTESDFIARVRSPATLSAHDQELLSAAGVSLSTTGRFLTLAKKLLPERTWLDLIGEARYAATAAAVTPRSPQAKLISEILSALRAQV